MTAFHPDLAKHLQDELDAARAELRRVKTELVERGGELGKLRCILGLEGTTEPLDEALRAVVAQRDTSWRLMEQAMRWLRSDQETVNLAERMAEEVVKAPPGFYDPPEA